MANNAFSTNKGNNQMMENSTDPQSLSQENVTQLLGLLEKMNQKNGGKMDATASNACAGKSKFLSSHAYLSKINSDSWILYSGASEHDV